MTSRSERVRELFDAALERPPGERSRFLLEACADDDALRGRVQSLLDAHERAADFLEGGAPASLDEEEPLRDGATVGAYRIVRKIGEGGMGLVFEAEQREPRRAVALKIIRGGAFVSDDTVRMFRREAQTLARLRHPGIAAIYEAGRTEDGRHFFAMELVRGETLEDWLRARTASVRDPGELRTRLAVFRRVCDAVQYAHQNGVIHRDLKPSNILVLPASSREALPEIKVLDFGLARITDIDAAVTTVRTVAGRIQGTLAYMSPEQARGRPEDVDTRSDVYALGVLLYRTLTGAVPVDLDGLSLVEALRAVEERPPRSFRSSLPQGTPRWRELEAVALKALEKEPARRYPGAAALAEDVERFLANQPVQARVPSAAYQLRKMVARHRLAFAFAAVLVFVLVTFAATATYQARRIARDAASARQVAGYLSALFESGGPGVLAEPGPGVREILDRGAAEIRRVFENDPLSYGRLAGNLGAAYMSGGAFREAAPFLEESYATLTEVLGTGHPETAAAAGRLARHRHAMGRYAEALALYDEALAGAVSADAAARILTSRATVSRAEEDYRRALELLEGNRASGTRLVRVRASEGLSEVLAASGRHEEAVEAAREALAGAEEALGPSSGVVGRLLAELSRRYAEAGEEEEARHAAASALDVVERGLEAPNPDLSNALRTLAILGGSGIRSGPLSPRWDAVVAGFDGLLAAPPAGARDVLETMDDPAEPLLTRMLAAQGKILTRDQPFAATALESMAEVYETQGRLGDAAALYGRCAEIRAAHLGAEHPDTVRASRASQRLAAAASAPASAAATWTSGETRTPSITPAAAPAP